MNSAQTDPVQPFSVRRPRVFLYSTFAGLPVASAVMLIWHPLNLKEQQQIERISIATAHSIEALIRQDMQSRVLALTGLAEH